MKKTYGQNAIVGQSGGPTAAINASLAGVISAWLERKNSILYGMANGITGIINEKLYNLNKIFLGKNDDLNCLKFTPAATLGSCRIKLKDFNKDPVLYENIFSVFEKYSIGYFFYIGGNDSMDTVAKLSHYADINNIDIKFVGIPKTVDNDLCCTDSTPGFGSAAKYIAAVCAEIRRDTAVYTQKSVTVIEIMGRDAGWLTASSVLANTDFSEGPDLIYLPEVPFSFDKCFSDIENAWKKHNDVLIAISEGIKYSDGSYVSADSTKTDNFGHAMLCGAANSFKEPIKERFGCKFRAIEINTVQRSAGHLLSLTDINTSFNIGSFGVSEALSGKTAIMVAITRISDDPYTIKFESFDINSIANNVKCVPKEFISQDENYITDAGIKYLRPLIMGQCDPIYLDGIPMHFILPKI